MRVVVGEVVVGHLEAVGHVEHGVGVDDALLDGAGHGDHLVDRAGLEHRGDRPVVPGVLDVALAVVGHAGHGQDLAGARPHDDGHAALGAGGGHLLAEESLGLVLQRLVEGQVEVGPLLGLLELAGAAVPSERKNREKSEAIRRGRKLARKKAIREGLIADPKKKLLDAKNKPGQRPGMGGDRGGMGGDRGGVAIGGRRSSYSVRRRVGDQLA